MRRTISRVSAPLETVDLEFERVLEQREEYVAELAISLPDESLNVDSLKKLLDARLPNANRKEPEEYADLLNDLAALGVVRVNQLADILDEQLKAILAHEAGVVERLRSGEEKEYSFRGPHDAERLKEGVFFTHVGLAR